MRVYKGGLGAYFPFPRGPLEHAERPLEPRLREAGPHSNRP